MSKNKLAAIVAVPMGAVWAIDHFITNMPMVMEGGLVVAGMGVAVLGANGVKQLLHKATADKPAEQATAAPSVAQEVAPDAPFLPPMTVHQLPPAPTREDLLKAFQMGAQAAQNTQRIER